MLSISFKRVAAELAKKEFDLREELQGEPLPPIRDVIERALANKEDKPVVLGDSADSPNAGATGDCATVIGELLGIEDAFDFTSDYRDDRGYGIMFPNSFIDEVEYAINTPDLD